MAHTHAHAIRYLVIEFAAYSLHTAGVTAHQEVNQEVGVILGVDTVGGAGLRKYALHPTELIVYFRTFRGVGIRVSLSVTTLGEVRLRGGG
jgi:hypothetical protein